MDEELIADIDEASVDNLQKSIKKFHMISRHCPQIQEQIIFPYTNTAPQASPSRHREA